GPVHKGFYDAYQPLKPQIIKELQKSKPKHLWVTGHSLGGALAVLCASDLIDSEHVKIDDLITFGQPMVAMARLAEYMGSQVSGLFAHYVNNYDAVPRVVPGYSHFGSLVWFTDDGIKRSKPKLLTVERDATSAMLDETDDELQPLTEEEFEQMKADLRDEQPVPIKTRNGKVIMTYSPRSIQDHDMRLYLEKIQKITRARR